MPPKRKTAKGNVEPKSSKRQKKTKVEDQEETQTEMEVNDTLKTIFGNGDRAPVDSFCTAKVGKAHVYVERGVVYDAMLNQTNIEFNNNKFYVAQLLEDKDGKGYSLWTRWGRVGKDGQNNLQTFGTNLEKAKAAFESKFKLKTGNLWEEKDDFVKYKGKYDIIQMDFKPTDSNTKESEVKVESVKLKESTLDERLHKLIKLICDIQNMEDTVLEMKYDSKKAPLGKLTQEQIIAGYSALKEIEQLLLEKNSKNKSFLEASNRFYTRIPHNFGMKTPPIINSEAQILEKMTLLQVLSDIEVAMKVLNNNMDSFENPIDRHYKSLGCNLEPLEKKDDVYKMIESYIKDTHATTHNHYKLKVLEIFDCSREGETENFIDLENKQLLWHGSRITNYAGILKQGLRIAPPEAPVTGYMFGKGVYFADRVSKSANYCFTSRSSPVGLLMLCEVSLGKCHELKKANEKADKLPKGFSSVKGLGSTIPNPNGGDTLPDGTYIPKGKGIQTKEKDLELLYNEYIVYDTKQIKIRYVVMVEFKFK